MNCRARTALRGRRAAAAAAAAAICLPGIVAALPARVDASTGAVIAFGRSGGNIMPFRVTIDRAGRVSAGGGVDRSRLRKRLSLATVSRLLTFARTEKFSSLPRSIACPGVSFDVASLFVTIRTAEGAKTVSEHGSCNRKFDHVYAAVSRAVRAR